RGGASGRAAGEGRRRGARRARPAALGRVRRDQRGDRQRLPLPAPRGDGARRGMGDRAADPRGDAIRDIIHVDMDAFYASVEQRDDPELRGRPVLVGGDVRRGVVTSASYEARPFGIRSAMPMAEAVARCPHAVVVRGRMDRYVAVAHELRAIFHRFTPLVEPLSLDEAFLDVTASVGLFGPAAEIARQIKTAIRAETSLTASAGVAPSKFVAKIASDVSKPDGLLVVAPEDVRKFLAPLPVRHVWGVGRVTEAALHRLGLRTIGDLAAADPHHLARHFRGGAAESVLFAVARKLLAHLDLGGRRVRLAGLAAANLVPGAAEQMALFTAARESATRRAAAARAVDELARRFGADVVRRRLPHEG